MWELVMRGNDNERFYRVGGLKKDCDHMCTVISDCARQETRGTNFEKLLEILSG
jgi:hypothetical protein